MNKEINTVCSVISGIISQEIIKIITNETPSSNLYIYDTELQSGEFILLSS